jgi:hypothetical protein
MWVRNSESKPWPARASSTTVIDVCLRTASDPHQLVLATTAGPLSGQVARDEIAVGGYAGCAQQSLFGGDSGYGYARSLAAYDDR